MKQPHEISSTDKTKPSTGTNPSLTKKQDTSSALITTIDPKLTAAKSTHSYLSIEVIQKMLNKFLTEKNISKEKLAEALGISIKELDDLRGNQNTSLISKINLPLIELYCETKWP